MPSRFKDEATQTFDYRAGSQLQFGGMSVAADPGGLPVNRPSMLVNARFFGGGYIPRPGLSEYGGAGNGDLGNGDVSSIYDFPIASPLKAWITFDGCPGIDSAVGASLATFDSEDDPELQRVLYFNGATSSVIFAGFDGQPYIGVDDGLFKINAIRPPYGEETLDVAGVAQQRRIKTYAAGAVSCMLEFDSKLFVGIDNGNGSSSVRYYDGLSEGLDLNSINPPSCMGIYRLASGDETLVIGFTATNQVRYRVKGDPTGTWTPVAPGAGTITARKMVRFKDVLYIASNGAADIWQMSDVALSVAHNVAGATMDSVCVHDGVLYFLYESATGDVTLGSYDGSTWTDSVFNLSGKWANMDVGRDIASYRGSLMVAGLEDTNKAYIYGNVGDLTDTDDWKRIVVAVLGVPADAGRIVVL